MIRNTLTQQWHSPSSDAVAVLSPVQTIKHLKCRIVVPAGMGGGVGVAGRAATNAILAARLVRKTGRIEVRIAEEIVQCQLRCCLYCGC